MSQLKYPLRLLTAPSIFPASDEARGARLAAAGMHYIGSVDISGKSTRLYLTRDAAKVPAPGDLELVTVVPYADQLLREQRTLIGILNTGVPRGKATISIYVFKQLGPRKLKAKATAEGFADPATMLAQTTWRVRLENNVYPVQEQGLLYEADTVLTMQAPDAPAPAGMELLGQLTLPSLGAQAILRPRGSTLHRPAPGRALEHIHPLALRGCIEAGATYWGSLQLPSNGIELPRAWYAVVQMP